MKSSTIDPRPIAEADEATGKVKEPRVRIASVRETPFRRCKHGKFADGCALCRYEEGHPELFAA